MSNTSVKELADVLERAEEHEATLRKELAGLSGEAADHVRGGRVGEALGIKSKREELSLAVYVAITDRLKAKLALHEARRAAAKEQLAALVDQRKEYDAKIKAMQEERGSIIRQISRAQLQGETHRDAARRTERALKEHLAQADALARP